MTDIKFFCMLIMGFCAITAGLCIGSMIGVNQTSVMKIDGHECIMRGAAFTQTMSCDWNTTTQRGK